MLFSYGDITIFKKNIINKTLQVLKILRRPRRNKRAALSASYGSITLEASLVLPIFLLAICSIMFFFSIINFQNNFQIVLENTARDISTEKYFFDSITDENSDKADKLITSAYAAAKVLNSKVNASAKKSGIVGGVLGISLIQSDLSMDKGYMDLVTDYIWKIPLINSNKVNLGLVQRCCFHPWIGESIVPSGKAEKGTKVYITKNGTVYHTFKTCTYLKIAIKKAKYKNIGNYRNANGGKYKKCSRCSKISIQDNSFVYITAFGDKYHTSSSCNTLMRYIQEIDISEAGNKKLCSKCAQSNK